MVNILNIFFKGLNHFIDVLPIFFILLLITFLMLDLLSLQQIGKLAAGVRTIRFIADNFLLKLAFYGIISAHEILQVVQAGVIFFVDFERV